LTALFDPGLPLLIALEYHMYLLYYNLLSFIIINCDNVHLPVAMWLFDGSVEQLPGGYDKGELSPNSPVKALKSFPQDLVLVGRSSILIKGLSNRLGIPWSLSKEWAPTARRVLEGNTNQAIVAEDTKTNKIRIKDVLRLLKTWGRGKASRAISRLPAPARTKVAAVALRAQKRREAKEAKQ